MPLPAPPEEIVALLRWYADMGVDTAIADELVDRFAESAVPVRAAPPALRAMPTNAVTISCRLCSPENTSCCVRAWCNTRILRVGPAFHPARLIGTFFQHFPNAVCTLAHFD